MVRIFWTNQEMNVDESRLSGGIKTHLNIWKDEVDIRKAPSCFELQDSFIVLCQVIVGYSNCTNWWGFRLKVVEVTAPGVGTSELVV